MAPPLGGKTPLALERELENRAMTAGNGNGQPVTRSQRLSFARTVWRDAGAIKTDRIRTEFKRLTRRIGQPELTCTKMLRHLFATCLQEANVDPLVRCELMGHSAGGGHSGNGLGMTAIYTHTRFETKRNQLESALSIRPSIDVAVRWLGRNTRRDDQVPRI
jgi:site-specific recombinase XerC